MKIAFDVGDIDIRNGGVTPYAERLLKAFDEKDDQDHEVVVVKRERPVPQPRRFSLKLKKRSRPWYQDSKVWKNFDVYHSPSQIVRSQDIPWIVTMHDVQDLHFPEYFSSADREFRAVYHREMIENADAVVVSFEHVRQDLLRFFDVPESRVHTVPLPLSHCGLPDVTTEFIEQTKRSLELPEEYILYPAQTWPHKNHLGLVEALRQLKSKGKRINLVCTGHVNEYFEETIKPTIDKHGLSDQIFMLGGISSDELSAVYRASQAVVIPTKYEAGSFPLIESMLMRQPVICASTTSLPDTIGADEFTFDPDDHGSMAEMIDRIVNDNGYRHGNVENSRRQTQDWHTTDVAKRYRDLWEQVAHNRR